MQYPEDLRSSLQNRRNINPAPYSVGAVLPNYAPSCRCPKAGSTPKQRQAGFGPFRYVFSSRERHLNGCVFYLETDFEKTHSVIFPILPFLAGTVELFSSVYTRQRLTSFMVKYYPTTRRASSPAFALLHGAFGWYNWHVCSSPSRRGHCFFGNKESPKERQLLMQRIPANLGALFSSGAALPSEKDEFGHTLLFVSEAKPIFEDAPATYNLPGTSPAVPVCIRNFGVVTRFHHPHEQHCSTAHRLWGGPQRVNLFSQPMLS